MTKERQPLEDLDNIDQSGNDKKTVITRPENSSRQDADNAGQPPELQEADATRLDSAAKTGAAEAAGSQVADETVISNRQFSAAVPKTTRHSEITAAAGTAVRQETLRHGETGLAAFSEENSEYRIGTGTVLKNRFELLEVIGAGGMGTVYKALDRRDIELGSSAFIAVKVLNSEYRSDPDVLKALHSEARKTQQLAHPNIITVYDFDRDQDVVFMTMEFMQGVPLNKVIEANPRGLPAEKALLIIEQMGEALAYAHSKLVIHSDFKPANVFIDRNDRVKVLDFGIARIADIARAPGFDAGVLGGMTPAYASLEMLQGKSPDVRDDIYALACVAYELLTGRHPYERESAQQAKSRNMRPLRVASLNRRQWAALDKALRFDRDRRTGSVRELLRGLHAAEATGGRRKWMPMLVVAGVALLTLGVAVNYWHLLPFPKKSSGVKQPVTQAVSTQKPQLPVPEVDARQNAAVGVEDVNDDTAKANTAVTPVLAATPVEPKIWTDKKAYRIGDEMVIRFSVREPLYVRIAVINSRGEISELFPNDLQQDNYCQPGKVYRIPPVDSGISLFVGEPVGTDRIVVLAGRKAFSMRKEDYLHARQYSAGSGAKDLTVAEVKYRIY